MNPDWNREAMRVRAREAALMNGPNGAFYRRWKETGSPGLSSPENEEDTMSRTFAFVVQSTEHEVGWGVRPDGWFLFESEAKADAWIKDQYATDVSKIAPAEYNTYDKAGYREVSPAILAEIEAAPNGLIWKRQRAQFEVTT